MHFPTTNWQQLAEATINGEPAGRAALAALCADYRAPVRAFLLSRGYAPEAADDFTQDFFAELLRTRAWKRADRARGRFRTFLLSILMRVLGRERERDNAEKRGGGQWTANIDDIDIGAEIAMAETVADSSTFDREWALRLMELTMATVEDSFLDKSMWAVLERFLPGAGESPSYEEAAAKLGVSVGAMKTSVHRVRQQFRKVLRSAVARTVGAVHEVDEELSYLHSVHLFVWRVVAHVGGGHLRSLLAWEKNDSAEHFQSSPAGVGTNIAGHRFALRSGVKAFVLRSIPLAANDRCRYAKSGGRIGFSNKVKLCLLSP